MNDTVELTARLGAPTMETPRGEEDSVAMAYRDILAESIPECSGACAEAHETECKDAEWEDGICPCGYSELFDDGGFPKMTQTRPCACFDAAESALDGVWARESEAFQEADEVAMSAMNISDTVFLGAAYNAANVALYADGSILAWDKSRDWRHEFVYAPVVLVPKKGENGRDYDEALYALTRLFDSQAARIAA